jgi:hypothetical protein
MPAITTNVEFGRYVGSGKCMYGRPDDSEKNRYLDWLYKKLNPNEQIHNSLEYLLKTTYYNSLSFKEVCERISSHCREMVSMLDEKK